MHLTDPHSDIVKGAGEESQMLTRRNGILAILIALIRSHKVIGDSLVTTNDFENGRFWKTLTGREKLLWISGALDSAAEFSKYVDAFHETTGVDTTAIMRIAKERFHPENCTRLEFSEKLDLVYRDPVNLILPIAYVFTICSKQFNGGYASDSEFQEELASTRKAYQLAVKR